MSDSLQPHGLRHVKSLCPSLSPGVCSISCPLSRWCHPNISSSLAPFSSYLQSFLASGSFPMSQLFTSGGQSIGAPPSATKKRTLGLRSTPNRTFRRQDRLIYGMRLGLQLHVWNFPYLADTESFPGGSDGKESACNAENLGLIPGWRRCPGERNGNPLQHSCLENSMDRGAWQATHHGVAKSWTRPSNWHTQADTGLCICH